MNKLWVRLSLGFSGMVLVAVSIVALTGILVGRGADPRFGPQAEAKKLSLELAHHYQIEQSWAGADLLLVGAQTVFEGQMGGNLAFFLADADRRVIYHSRAGQVEKRPGRIRPAELWPIQVEGQTVGYLGLGPVFMRPGRPPSFVEFLGRSLLTVAVVAGVGGVLFGVLMSRSLTAPLNSLAEAARAIGARNLSRRVEEKGSDEIRAVARSFNEMAAALEEGEQLRRNLLADVAHELRTPLTVLQGNLRAILDEIYPLNREEITHLYEHTRFLSRLVNDLHELAQAEARQLPLNLQETDLAGLIKTTGDTFRPSAETKNIRLQTELPANLPLLKVDAARLTQVLQNLLANALRHTPAGGTITIQVRPGPGDLQLIVSDTGEGISPEHLPYIFDRFYRTDPARSRDRGGAGLGLAISRAIVEAHGGRISVASGGGPGQGTTFTIQFPFSKASYL